MFGRPRIWDRRGENEVDFLKAAEAERDLSVRKGALNPSCSNQNLRPGLDGRPSLAKQQRYRADSLEQHPEGS